MSQKPLISDASLRLEPNLLNELVSHISTLASIYHKPPGKLPNIIFAYITNSLLETFVSKLRKIQKIREVAEKDERSQKAEGN